MQWLIASKNAQNECIFLGGAKHVFDRKERTASLTRARDSTNSTSHSIPKLPSWVKMVKLPHMTWMGNEENKLPIKLFG